MAQVKVIHDVTSCIYKINFDKPVSKWSFQTKLEQQPCLLMTLMSPWLINTKDKLLFDTSWTICATGLHRTHELTKGAFIIYLEGGL